MTKIARGPAAGKALRRPDATAGRMPAPSPAMLCLLRLLRRPMPLGELRPAAAAAGMAEPELAAAISTDTRRQVIGLAAVAGTAYYVRRRPGA